MPPFRWKKTSLSLPAARAATRATAYAGITGRIFAEFFAYFIDDQIKTDFFHRPLLSQKCLDN
jgi:hypothetical protein